MARLINPVLFSVRFKVPAVKLDKAGLIDPILNTDTKLFIDPLLLASSTNKLIKKEALALLKKRFAEIVRLVAASDTKGDLAWRTAAKFLDLTERPETGLGYGGSSTSGSSRPNKIKQQVLATAREVVDLGSKDPQIISLMGIFEEGVGPDTISDLTTNIILPVLGKITAEFCSKNGIPTKKFHQYGGISLPANPMRKGGAIILVPRDVLRDLPLAADWSDVSRVILEVAEIRDAFNRFIGPIAKATLGEKKQALRRAALTSLDVVKQILAAVVDASDNYDPNEDALNYYAFRKLITSDHSAFKGKIKKPASATSGELRRVVSEIIEEFRHKVEKNNMWELLWIGDKPKRERAAQLLFFAVADVYCNANDLDISPETHSGGGPVDFKFSKGYRKRIVVEMKRSVGAVVSGYERQLEIYKEAARTDLGIFIIIDVGGMGKKLKQIKAIEAKRIAAGEPASTIVVINARRKPSASKV